MALRRIRDNGRRTVAVSGELDMEGGEELRRAIEQDIDEAEEGVHLDLSGVTFIDSMGVKCLLYAAALADRREVPLTLGYGPAVRRIVDALGLGDRLPSTSSPA